MDKLLDGRSAIKPKPRGKAEKPLFFEKIADVEPKLVVGDGFRDPDRQRIQSHVMNCSSPEVFMLPKVEPIFSGRTLLKIGRLQHFMGFEDFIISHSLKPPDRTRRGVLQRLDRVVGSG